MQTTIEKIGDHAGQTVTIKGWLHNRRSSGKIHFLTVRDGSGFLQVVMGKRDVDEATFQKADHLGQAP
jgi:asparaginyl-tRNA synthetase